MSTIELVLEIAEQVRFLERLTPGGEAWNVAVGYLIELWTEYRRRSAQ